MKRPIRVVNIHCEHCREFICKAQKKGWMILDTERIKHEFNCTQLETGVDFVHDKCYDKYRFPWRFDTTKRV